MNSWNISIGQKDYERVAINPEEGEQVVVFNSVICGQYFCHCTIGNVVIVSVKMSPVFS